MRRRRKRGGSIIFTIFMLPLLLGFILLAILVDYLKSMKIPGGDLFRRHRVKY